MASLDSLIAQVNDDQLRRELEAAAADLRKTSEFGLVFERHIPESVRLPHHPLRRGVKVAIRNTTDKAVYLVEGVDGPSAQIRRLRNDDGTPAAYDPTITEHHLVDNLVAVAEFGEPVYPGLRRLGGIDRGADRPAHLVIKGENHHVLEALRFTHSGKIDACYIDPPFNTGARDWKYGNAYVDENDAYRHSKWLAFMERRLAITKELLNPDDSVLIVAIDEKEYLRLGLLLEQMFSDAKIQMVTTVMKPEGTGRVNEFSRTNEFLYFVLQGAATIKPGPDNMYDRDGTEGGQPVEWRNLRRRERTSTRGARPNQFYAVFVDDQTGAIHSVGDALANDIPRDSVEVPPGTTAVFPLTPNGTEMLWSLVPSSLRELVAAGYARASGAGIQFLNSGTIAAIDRGDVIVTGKDDQGAVIAQFTEAKALMPKTVWTRESHNAQTSGTLMLTKLIPGRHFPFPKSLYAVEDALRFVVKDKPHAVILDFFGGSGTTSHAVARLNKEDGGQRQSIVITNNEVSASEAAAFTKDGLAPGDDEWEELGIFEHVTRPRVTAAVTGTSADGKKIQGDYKFGAQSAIGDGFDENVEFLELTYQDAGRIELDLAFNAIAPLLWLRAGAQGPVLEDSLDSAGRRKPYGWTSRYGVLFNTDRWSGFIEKMPDTVTTVFIVTDSMTTFAQIAAELPGHVDAVRLYERYLTTFAINIHPTGTASA